MRKTKKKGEYIYFIRIGEPQERLFKIGTTNNIKRRMKEHEKTYHKKITVLWISSPYSKYTTLRVEDNMINKWKEEGVFKYIRNDRFVIPPWINKVKIKVRKEWTVIL